MSKQHFYKNDIKTHTWIFSNSTTTDCLPQCNNGQNWSNYFTQTADSAHVKILNVAGKLHEGRHQCTYQMNAVSAEHQHYW